jgi:catechol 2,3-dioxygenase-like lactoylglutathione lyase family enzyme
VVSSASVPNLRWNAVCVDCADGDFAATVAFYTGLLGLEIGDGSCRPGECTHDGTSHWASLGDPGGGMAVNVQSESWYEPPVWPERPDGLTKMLHFEVETDDVAAAVRFAVAAGAREAPHQPPDRDLTRLRVMLDPAGHPFCLWS